MSISSVLRSLLFLRLIAVFKFIKATLVVATGIGVLSLADPLFIQSVRQFADSLSEGLEQRLLRNLLAMLVGVAPGKLHLLAVASFLYAALFTVEGIGLWRGRHWAEWLTVIATSSLVPIEVYELIRAPHRNTLLVLIANLLILGYLVWRMRKVSPGQRAR